ncbi:hypothetical protein [Streptomyces sp. NPDC008125]|uniref:hypothetical protein n=1 Tax=Streptomyces sp. NPDC008125 TaxID=3364811 RepID=UPI0036EE3D8A
MARIRTTGGATVAGTALSAATVFDGAAPAAARAHAEDEGNIWDLFPRDEG